MQYFVKAEPPFFTKLNQEVSNVLSFIIIVLMINLLLLV